MLFNSLFSCVQHRESVAVRARRTNRQRRPLRPSPAGQRVRRIRFHDLRHTCASLLLAQNVPARVVMEILGHSQLAITTDLYSHVMPTALREAADAMDRVFVQPN